MNLIQKKLRSQSGASLLIALMFMLFCLFVGGAVLVAASANGYRVAHLSDQQDFLSQRSACLLLADEIDGNRGGQHKLTVTDVTEVYQPLTVLPGGGRVEDTSRPTVTEHTLTFGAGFTAANSMTTVQRIMYETAVCRYLLENGIDLTGIANGIRYHVSLEGFYYNGSAFTLDNFWCRSNTDGYCADGSIRIKGITGANNIEFTDYTAYFNCGTGERLFDFYVNFGTYTQMTVAAEAYFSDLVIGPIRDEADGTLHIQQTQADGSTVTQSYSGHWEVNRTTHKTTVGWEEAYIEKGGA